ncbi:MAG TPA: AbrB/MazE/SpoVT family DNA-binding domain-containing protein [Pirellulaceae bacterium]|nr:AbrB/MazE/SpoVT family DNA-binding domain-containing protein [Pirellulaceae bacterium]
MSTKGRITLPADFRNRDNVRAGEEFDISRVQAGEYLLKRVSNQQRYSGRLRACPEEDWFQEIPSDL